MMDDEFERRRREYYGRRRSKELSKELFHLYGESTPWDDAATAVDEARRNLDGEGWNIVLHHEEFSEGCSGVSVVATRSETPQEQATREAEEDVSMRARIAAEDEAELRTFVALKQKYEP